MINPRALKGLLFALVLVIAGGFLFEYGVQFSLAMVGQGGFYFFVGGALLLTGLVFGLCSLYEQN